MKTNKKIIFSLFLLIFLVACEEEQQQVQQGFVGGTQGLVLSFEDFGVLEDGMPTVYSTEDFPVIINAKNKGEYDVAPSELTITIKGISLRDFQGITPELKNNQKIDGVSEFNTNGGEIDLNFAPSRARYNLPIVGAYQPFEIYADAVYIYKTKLLTPQVCFKENLRDTSICNVKEAKTFFNSGAPIIISSVEQDTAGAGIIALKIIARNAGTGRVTIPAADFESRYDRFAFTTPEGFECTSGGRTDEAKFIDGNAEIRCKLKQPLEKGAAYIKPFSLELNYKYKETISKPIRIRSQQ